MNEIRKKIEKIEEMKEQIRLEKEKMNTQIGRQLLAKLNIQHEDLSKKKVDELLDTLASLYHKYQTSTKNHE